MQNYTITCKNIALSPTSVGRLRVWKVQLRIQSTFFSGLSLYSRAVKIQARTIVFRLLLAGTTFKYWADSRHILKKIID